MVNAAAAIAEQTDGVESYELGVNNCTVMLVNVSTFTSVIAQVGL